MSQNGKQTAIIFGITLKRTLIMKQIRRILPQKRKNLIYHFGWTQELVIAKPQGKWPQQQEDMNQEYIDQYLKYFRYGASFIIITAWFNDNSRNQERYICDTHIPNGLTLENSKWHLSIVERNFGVTQGGWQFRRLSRIYVPFPKKFNVRMTTGNEVDANWQRRPGSVLLNGLWEAVIDIVPKSVYQQFQLNPQ